MKYIVTGGAGFIGSNLVDFLIDKNNEVHIIDNFSSGKKLFEINIAGEIPSDKYYKFPRKTMRKKNKEVFLQFQEI